MGPLPESNFPYKTAVKLQVFIFFKVFYKKLILWKYVFYTVNIRFFEVPGGPAGLSLGSILGPFSIKNLIKNRCKNRCRKSYEIWCQNDQKWRQHGSKNHDFLSLFAKRWLYENVSFTWEIQGFLRYRPSKIHQQFIQEPSKNHQRFMLEKVMQKGWKSGPKWSQNGVQNRLKINPKINQKIDVKKDAFWTFFGNGEIA